MRLAPQGITGTSYLEIDYVDPPPPVLPIDWTPDNIYIPSAPSTVTALVNAASEIMDKLHKLDLDGTFANLNTLLVTTNARIDAIDTKAISDRSAERVLAKIETTLDGIDAKKLSDEAAALLAEVRETNAELRRRSSTSRRCRSSPTMPPRRSRGCGSSSTIPTCRRRCSTCRRRSAGSTGSWAAAKPTSRSPSRTCARSPTTCAT